MEEDAKGMFMVTLRWDLSQRVMDDLSRNCQTATEFFTDVLVQHYKRQDTAESEDMMGRVVQAIKDIYPEAEVVRVTVPEESDCDS